MQHNQKMFSYHDQKGEIFHPPFCKNTHGEAEREFMTLVNEEKTIMNVYPEDWDLYYVGNYDTQTGKIEPLKTPEHVIKAISVKRNSPKPLSDQNHPGNMAHLQQ